VKDVNEVHVLSSHLANVPNIQQSMAVGFVISYLYYHVCADDELFGYACVTTTDSNDCFTQIHPITRQTVMICYCDVDNCNDAPALVHSFAFICISILFTGITQAAFMF
jgi:hypothetical protein